MTRGIHPYNPSYTCRQILQVVTAPLESGPDGNQDESSYPLVRKGNICNSPASDHLQLFYGDSIYVYQRILR